MEKHTTLIKVADLTISIGKHEIIKDVSFSLEKGEIGCLLGPSGCGKTTLLRSIAGFEQAQQGEISIGDKIISSESLMVPPEQRNIGMVFQDYALFPHLSVAENIGFGLKISRKERRRTVARLLDLVGLTAATRAYPHELSGGQQQRVALARAIAPEPTLLLMDEPFSNLDVALRDKLTVEVRDILKETGITALIVTHNQFEAFSVADSVGVIFAGSLQQWDSAYNVYHRPATLEVATFVGDGAIIRGMVDAPRQVSCGLGKLSGDLSLPCESGCHVDLLVRPEDVLHDDNSLVKARILHKSFRGPNILYKLELPSQEICLALVSSHHDHKLGEYIGIVPEVENLVVFPAAAPIYIAGKAVDSK
jgi:iron(III) transport system ATP-binding protein